MMDRLSEKARNIVAICLMVCCLGILLWQGSVLKHTLELRQTESTEIRFWRDLVYNSPTGVVIVDAASGVIVDWNMGATKLLGWKSDEVIGHRFTFLIPERSHELAETSFKRANEHWQNPSQVIRCTGWVVCKDGSHLKAAVSLRGITTSGRYYVAHIDPNVMIRDVEIEDKPPPPRKENEPVELGKHTTVVGHRVVSNTN